MKSRALRRRLVRTLKKRRRELRIEPVRATARRISLATSFWFFMLFGLAWLPATRFIEASRAGVDTAPILGCFIAYQTAFLLGGIAHFADIHNRARGWLQAWLPFAPRQLWRIRWKAQLALWLGLLTWVPMLIAVAALGETWRVIFAGLLFVPALFSFAWWIAIRFPFNAVSTPIVGGLAYLFGILAFLGLQGLDDGEMWGWAAPLLVLLADFLKWITPAGWWWLAANAEVILPYVIGFGLLTLAALLLPLVRKEALQLFERTHFEEASGDAFAELEDHDDDEPTPPPFGTPPRDASSIEIEPWDRETVLRQVAPPVAIPVWMPKLLIAAGIIIAGWIWFFGPGGFSWLVYLGSLVPWVLSGATKLGCETGTAIQPAIQIPGFALLPLDLESLRERSERQLRRWLLRSSPYWVIYTLFGSWIFEAGWGAHLAFAMGLVIWAGLAHRATFSWAIGGCCSLALRSWRAFLYQCSRLMLGIVVVAGGISLFVTAGITALDPPAYIPWNGVVIFSASAMVTWSAAWSSWALVSQGLANGWLDQVSPTPTAVG